MLGNQVELWETAAGGHEARRGDHPRDHRCCGAARPRGPTGPGRRPARRRRRIGCGGKFDDVPGDYTRIAVGGAPQGWLDYDAADAAPADFTPDGVTRADDPLLLYFTSGTTARPKLVEHTHASYPVGHLSTMYWIGLRARRRAPQHLLAGLGEARLEQRVRAVERRGVRAGASTTRGSTPRRCSRSLDRCRVTSFCAPPTVWRMLIQADLTGLRTPAARGRGRRASRSTPRSSSRSSGRGG